MNIQEITPSLQLSIGPVILISGIGLVLLSMTNRYGRVIDRARQLNDAARSGDRGVSAYFTEQLAILAKRAGIMRVAILLASSSVLFAAVLIMLLFPIAYYDLSWGWLVVALFSGCLASFVASLVLFIRDVNLSLKAFDLAAKSGARDSAAS